ncbi:MAG: spore cortex biosynthesis protein YabQ [Lachnospiraceae bacterium]|nr:spore cortex biosynthesis protein YabQ [Lachnospiraceae bacterium]
METGIGSEVKLFLISILAGMILFGVFDIGKAFREAIRHKNSWVAAEDFLYWIFASFFLFYIFFAFNEGVLRNYVIWGSLGGIRLYYLCFRKLFLKPFFLLFCTIGKLLCFFRFFCRNAKKFFVKVCILPLKKVVKTITIVLRRD